MKKILFVINPLGLASSDVKKFGKQIHSFLYHGETPILGHYLKAKFLYCGSEEKRYEIYAAARIIAGEFGVVFPADPFSKPTDEYPKIEGRGTLNCELRDKIKENSVLILVTDAPQDIDMAFLRFMIIPSVFAEMSTSKLEVFDGLRNLKPGNSFYLTNAAQCAFIPLEIKKEIKEIAVPV